MLKIVLVEDDSDLNELLCLHLASEGMDVLSFSDLPNLEDVLENGIDAIIIDRNLPSGDSLRAIQKLRKLGYEEPVIFLTALTQQEEIYKGFESGCNDYICKPFEIRELLLRLQALFRHKIKNKIQYQDFVLFLETRESVYQGKEVALSYLEFELLRCFFESRQEILTRQYLSENVWKNDTTSDKSINIAIMRLKKKFPILRDRIFSVRGMGYKLC